MCHILIKNNSHNIQQIFFAFVGLLNELLKQLYYLFFLNIIFHSEFNKSQSEI